jgi:hypothetical protein
VTIPGDSIADKATEGKVRVQTAVEAPLGQTTLALQAKGKLAGADRIIAVPAVTLSVVRPASVEFPAAAIEVKSGTNAELKGRVVRKGTFNEPVTVRINGLPAGLKADAVTVAPGSDGFSVKVIADAKSATTTATAQVLLAFQVNKKDYSVPPTPLAVKVLPSK